MVGDPVEEHEYIETDRDSIVRSVGLNITEPAAKVRNEGGRLVIEIDLPGIRQNHIALLLKKDSLSLTADKEETRVIGDVGFYTSDSVLGCYSMREDLPSRIVPEKAVVTFDKGVLRIEAPVDGRAAEKS